MPVQQLVHAEVLVVVSEGIVEGLRHPEPAEEEEKLEAEEDGDPDVDGFLLVGVLGEEGLVPHQGHREVGVHRQGYHLRREGDFNAVRKEVKGQKYKKLFWLAVSE